MGDHFAERPGPPPDRLRVGYERLLHCSRHLSEVGDERAIMAIACSTARWLVQIGEGIDDGAPDGPLPSLDTVADPAIDQCCAQVTSADYLEHWTENHLTEQQRSNPIHRRLLAELAATVASATANLQVSNGLRAAAERQAAELDAFSYAISHDLRAPIRHLEGFTRILLLNLADQAAPGDVDPQLRQSAERIEDAARRVRDMVDGLLTFSRTSQAEIQPQSVDLAELARTVADRLAHDAAAAGGTGTERAGVVEFVVPQRLPVTGDPRLLLPMLQHLLANATAQRIVAKHGGTMTADGLPGHGATFSFTLPG